MGRSFRLMARGASEVPDVLGAPMVVKSDPVTMGLLVVDQAVRPGRLRPAASARGGGHGLPHPHFAGARMAGSDSVEGDLGVGMDRAGETRQRDRYVMPKARREAPVEKKDRNLAMGSDLDGLETGGAAFGRAPLHGDRTGVTSAPRPAVESWAAVDTGRDGGVEGEAPATLVVNQGPVETRRGLRPREGDVADG